MQDTSEEPDPAVELLNNTVDVIRKAVESSFTSAGEERFQRHGEFRTRVGVQLSDEMWKHLQIGVKASIVLSGLQLTRVERWIEVVMSREAQEKYAFHRPGVKEKAEKAEKEKIDPIACAGLRTPEPKPPLQEVPTPCKVQNPKRRLATPDATASDKQEKPKRIKTRDPKTAKASMPLSHVGARDVPRDLKGVQTAQKGLVAALERKDLHAAVAWLKGLERRKITLKELEETRIGCTVNDWRKQEDPFVSKLAHLLWQRRAKGSLSARSILQELYMCRGYLTPSSQTIRGTLRFHSRILIAPSEKVASRPSHSTVCDTCSNLMLQ